LIECPDPKADETTAVVKVAAASITPSDVKNVAGSMEHATLPRVLGSGATTRAQLSKVRRNGSASKYGELEAKLAIRLTVAMPI
jgi:NADPH:quinone reductase-like Zn-dependent oxidoreductase